MKLYSIVFSIQILLILNKNNDCFEYSCEECTSNNYGNCTKCKNGFTLIDGTCPCFNLECALCINGNSELNSCLLCKNDYYTYNNIIENKIVCKCKISGCKICPNDKCIKCEDNYYYDKNTSSCIIKKCNDINCDICSLNKCIKCKNNYYLKKGKCYKISSLFKCNNINECLTCFNKNECYECNRGYYKKGKKCEKCIKGCSYCINSKECEYCLNGFELTKEKKCKFTNNFDFNISLYNFRKNNLIKLNISQELNISIDLSKLSNFYGCGQNCELCDDKKGECIKYNNNYKIIKKKYEIIKRNLFFECNILNCKRCFNKNNLIICLQCYNGYYLDTITNVCYKSCDIPYCLQCTENKNFCIQCSDKRVLKNGKCYGPAENSEDNSVTTRTKNEDFSDAKIITHCIIYSYFFSNYNMYYLCMCGKKL